MTGTAHDRGSGGGVRREPPVPEQGGMRLTRRHGWLLLAIAAWNVLSFGSFAGQLYEAWAAGEERPPGYWLAHTVLIVVNMLIAAVLGRLGWRALRDPS